MCISNPLSGIGLLNSATGGKLRPLALLSPAAALMTGGLTKKKKPDATQTGMAAQTSVASAATGYGG